MFNHLELWIALAGYNFKWLKIEINVKEDKLKCLIVTLTLSERSYFYLNSYHLEVWVVILK